MLQSVNCRCILRAVQTARQTNIQLRINESCIVMECRNYRRGVPQNNEVQRQHSCKLELNHEKSLDVKIGELHQPAWITSQDVSTESRSSAVTTSSHWNVMNLQEEKLKQQWRFKRRWEYTNLGRELKHGLKRQPKDAMVFTVLSYNVLAQVLLEQHPHLYHGKSLDILNWEYRSERILREFADIQSDVLCLQEVQEDHYSNFYVPKLNQLGYEGVFKKRTGDKPDGCAIFYRTSIFDLLETISVEYCRPNVSVLDRDNVGLIALLTPRGSPRSSASSTPFVCIATTHLLYNPRRHDVKLAQLQLLFAELDKIAYKDNYSSNCHFYHPVILTGDFNLTPNSSVYHFITKGVLHYEGLRKGNLTPENIGPPQSNELIPPHLNVTDQCQYLQIVEKRIMDQDAEARDSSDERSATFSSGKLSHQLRFQSAYTHKLRRYNGLPEVTTHQDDWVTVDYIFYSHGRRNSPLQLLYRLGLVSGSEIESFGGLPNMVSPSDHLPLVASFLWDLDSSKT